MLSVVMPAHNEADFLVASVEEVLAGLRTSDRPFEVIVVENGSSDGTAALAEGLAERHAEVGAHSRPEPDYGAALRAGFLAATGDVVVNFDVDFFDLGFLERAVARIREPGGPAVVIGSKRATGSSDRRPWPRRFVTGVFSFVLRRGFGLGVSDTHGIKALDRARVADLVAACRFGTDLFDTELVLRVERAGLAVEELPVVVEERRPPRTSIARRALRSVAGLARLRLTLARERRGG